MVLFTETPKDSTKKLLELRSEFSKVARYKANIQKSTVFLYTNLKKKKISNHYNCNKKYKHLGKNLTNGAKDLSSGNYKTLMKEKVKTQINAHGLEEYC